MNDEMQLETYEVLKNDLENLEEVVNSYPKGYGEEKSGLGLKKGNRWMEHVQKIRLKDNLSLREALMKAKKTYKK